MLNALAGGTISILLILGGCGGHNTALQTSCWDEYHGINEDYPGSDAWVETICGDPALRPPGSISTTNTPDGKCHEDDPCWDCPTMGNMTCGPDAPDWMRDGDPTTGP